MIDLKTSLKFCLVTDIDMAVGDYAAWINHVVRAGVTMIQLRDKTMEIEKLRDYGVALKKVLTPLGVPLIINDYVDIALAIDADGVHLGQKDMHPNEARQRLGPKKIIGLSVETRDNLEYANTLNSINYVAISPVFKTSTKTDCQNPWEIAGLKDAVQKSKHALIAIGGMQSENIQQVLATGVDGIAMISAIHKAADPIAFISNLFDLNFNVSLEAIRENTECITQTSAPIPIRTHN